MVRMIDVAREAGVSVATVSRVINGTGNVNDEMRERVRAAVRKMDFKPNQLARALKNIPTRLIGLIVPKLDNPFFYRVTSGIQSRIASEGYELITACSDDDPAREREIIGALRAKQIDGLIICPCAEDNKDLLQNSNFPVVAFDRTYLKGMCDMVYVDKADTTYKAVSYLLENGHQNIAMVTGRKEIISNYERYNGYLRAYYEHNVMPNQANLFFGDFAKAYGKQVLKEIVDEHQDITAVICGSAVITEGVIAQAKAMRVRIPEDISLISSGTIEYQDCIEPIITHISEKRTAISNKTAELIMSRIKNPDQKLECCVLTSNLEIGNSVRRLG